MAYIMVDIEANGPIPGDYSMIALGAVVVDENLDKTFLDYLKPISPNFDPESLSITGFTHEQTLDFNDPAQVMKNFEFWIKEHTWDLPMFISDNNGYDFMFVCWYFYHFLGRNPFGHTSTNLGSLYKGLVRNVRRNFKHSYKPKHTHNPLEDAIANAKAFLQMSKDFGLDIIPKIV